jgi:hypothetical protein
MTIPAIPTWYAGCYFRSRLEARWAVFFDALRIRWQYEAQDFEVGWRLKHAWCSEFSNCGSSAAPCGGLQGFRYLPDFWLPDLELHVEVKGSLDWPHADRLLNAVASLGGCGTSGHDLVVLGPIPSDKSAEFLRPLPVRLHMHEGSLMASGTELVLSGSACPGGETLATDCSGDDYGIAYEWGDSTGPYAVRLDRRQRYVIDVLLGEEAPFRRPWMGNAHQHRGFEAMRAAYTAARSARFEWGESGSMVGTKPPLSAKLGRQPGEDGCRNCRHALSAHTVFGSCTAPDTRGPAPITCYCDGPLS